MPMPKRPLLKWSTIGEALRWRGLFVFFLLSMREILRPLMYWHVFYIFEIDLTRQQVPEPYADEKIDVRIHAGAGDLERAKAEIVSMGQLKPAEVNSRFNRGDKAAIAYVGDEPTGYAWLSFTSGVVELAFGFTWIVGPGEAIRYDSFILPKWRGRRIYSCLHSAIVACARDHGIFQTLASISTVNTQSMTLAKHYQRTAAMKVTLVHFRGLNWTFKKAVGAPFESRFLKPA
jgi:GNAT superfamily N-acetyltransferase